MDKSDIKKEVEIELDNLDRLVKEMEDLTRRFTNEPDFIQARAAGSIIHDFYCGVEKLFERVAVNIDGELPKGEDWHTELLSQMARPLVGIREAVINQDLLGKSVTSGIAGGLRKAPKRGQKMLGFNGFEIRISKPEIRNNI